MDPQHWVSETLYLLATLALLHMQAESLEIFALLKSLKSGSGELRLSVTSHFY
jgi:hypothetical protein